MGAVVDTTLARWGNSQGFRVPKEMCDFLGVRVGSKAHVRADQAKSQLIITFEQPVRTYQRNRKVSMEELCEGWCGGKVGEEWGGSDIGAEVVE